MRIFLNDTVEISASNGCTTSNALHAPIIVVKHHALACYFSFKCMLPFGTTYFVY